MTKKKTGKRQPEVKLDISDTLFDYGHRNNAYENRTIVTCNGIQVVSGYMSIKEFTKRGTPLLYKFPALAMLIRNFATKKMTNSDEISISLLVEFLHNAESFENFKEIINNDEKLADVVLQTGYLGVVKPYIDQNNSDEYKIFRNAYFYNQM